MFMRFIKNSLYLCSIKKLSTMKRISFFALLMITVSFTMCSGNNDKESAKTVNPGEGVVNQMDAAMFSKIVWDYKTSPEVWKYLGDQPCIIDFYADWCRPCKLVAPIMEDLAKEYKGQVRFYKVNTDEQKELAGLFRVTSIPAILIIPKNGKPQMTMGAQPKENFVKAIKEIILTDKK